MKYTIQLSDIKRDVEYFFKVNDIAINSRKRDAVMQRNLYYKLSKKFTFESLEKIGEEVNRNHATVIHGLDKYNDLIRYFKYIDHAYKMLSKKYKNIILYDGGIDVYHCDLVKNEIFTKRQLSA